MLSEADILAALRDCFDPEVKLNIVDLGLIYSIAIEADPDSTPRWPRQRVRVTMTVAVYDGRPQDAAVAAQIVEQVENRLATIRGIGKAEVNLMTEPKWTPHRISAAGRRQLGL